MGIIISKSLPSSYSPASTTSCTTSSTYAPTSSSTVAILQVTKVSSTPVPTITSTSTTSSPTPTSTPTFYLKSSCDNSCLGVFAADDQIYSNAYTSTDSTFNAFYLSSGTLYDASTGTLCVSSQAGGSETRFQCSNDLDVVNGVTVAGGWSSANGLLTYQGSPTWYGCGVLNLADNYEPNGLTYSTAQGDPSNCRACTFSMVTDVSQCSGQTQAASTSTTYLPYTSLPAATSSTTSKLTTSSSSQATTLSTKTSTAVAVAPTPGNSPCQTGRCSVNWLQEAACYIQDCSHCPWGTWCQQYQFWPLSPQWACLPIRIF